MAKVSIIVPVYNVEKYIEKCILSLKKQSFRDCEFIIVNDGSTDKSYSIAKKLINGDKRFVLITQDNKGLSGARNAGLKYASGEYLMFLDSDDSFRNDIVEKCYKRITENNSDIVIFSFNKVDENNNIVERNEVNRDDTILLSENKKVMKEVENCIWDKMYKSYLFDEITFPENLLYEDLGTTYRIFPKAKRITFLNEIGIDYLYKREGSITKTFDNKIYSIFSICDLLICYYKKNNLYDVFRNELDYIMYREIIECVKQAVIECKDDYKLRDSFIDDAYKYIHDNFGNKNYNLDNKSCVYKNKNTLKLYLLVRNILNG